MGNMYYQSEVGYSQWFIQYSKLGQHNIASKIFILLIRGGNTSTSVPNVFIERREVEHLLGINST